MEHSMLIKKLRKLRKKSGYTQATVSQMLNIQRQTYCNYENGLRTPPIDIILSIANLYHVTVDSLLLEEYLPSIRTPPLTEKQLKLVTDFSDLSERQQKEVLCYIAFKKQYPF